MPDIKFSSNGTSKSDPLPDWEKALSLTDKVSVGTRGGLSMVYINNSQMGRNKYEIQLGGSETDYFSCPFGVGSYSGNNEPRMELPVKLHTQESGFCFRSLDAYILDCARKNMKVWWPDVTDFDRLEYKGCLNQKEDYDPLLKCKIRLDNADEKRKCMFFKVDGTTDSHMPNLTKVDTFDEKIDLLTKGSNFITIVSPTSIWFKGNQFGLTIEMKYLAVVTETSQQESQNAGFVWNTPTEQMV